MDDRRGRGFVQAAVMIRHFLAVAGLILILAFGLAASVSYRGQIIASVNDADFGNDMVSVWDRMMRKIIPDLPDHGIVGYLADWDIPDYTYGHSDQTVEYLLTQYALAPLTLQRGEDYPVIIGNFSDDGDPEKIPAVLSMFDVVIQKQHTNEIFILQGKAE